MKALIKLVYEKWDQANNVLRVFLPKEQVVSGKYTLAVLAQHRVQAAGLRPGGHRAFDLETATLKPWSIHARRYREGHHPLLRRQPQGTEKLDLSGEIAQIKAQIKSARYGERLNFIPLDAAGTDQLQENVLRHQPQIIHISGHGRKDGYLLLQDKNNRPKRVSTTALVELFKLYREFVRAVVFNACFTPNQVEALGKLIGCGIGMSWEISDEAAIVFAVGLYRGIAYAYPVSSVFRQAVGELMLEGTNEHDTRCKSRPTIRCARSTWTRVNCTV